MLFIQWVDDTVCVCGDAHSQALIVLDWSKKWSSESKKGAYYVVCTWVMYERARVKTKIEVQWWVRAIHKYKFDFLTGNQINNNRTKYH